MGLHLQEHMNLALYELYQKWQVSCRFVHDYSLKRNSNDESDAEVIDWHFDRIRFSFEAIQAICNLYEVENPVPRVPDDNIRESLERVVLPFIKSIQRFPSFEGVSNHEGDARVENVTARTTSLEGEGTIVWTVQEGMSRPQEEIWNPDK